MSYSVGYLLAATHAKWPPEYSSLSRKLELRLLIHKRTFFNTSETTCILKVKIHTELTGIISACQLLITHNSS